MDKKHDLRWMEEEEKTLEKDQRRSHLLEHGFSQEIVDFIESKNAGLPSMELVDNKIIGLERMGFTDPVKLISAYPAILNYSIKSIDARLRFVRRLLALYKLPFTANEFLEANIDIFGTKMEKLFILVRVLKESLGSTESVSVASIRRLIRQNLEDVLLPLIDKQDSRSSVQKLTAEASRIRNRSELSPEGKRLRIEKAAWSSPKIQRAYMRGYPKKED